MVLQEKLGLPLTEGDFKALFRRLDKVCCTTNDFNRLLFWLNNTGEEDASSLRLMGRGKRGRLIRWSHGVA